MNLYLFPAATTSRAVHALCVHEDLDVDVTVVDLTKGQHHQPPFCELNPNRLVPALDDDGFVLTEASAILRYLASKADSPLYPKDPMQRARVDERIAWFEANLYKDFGFSFVYPQLMDHHRRRSEEANEATIEFGRAQSRRWLSVLDRHYLADGQTYLVGDQLTIADLLGASIVGLGELVRCSFADYPNVRRWYRAVTGQPCFTEVNGAFLGFAESLGGQSFAEL